MTIILLIIICVLNFIDYQQTMYAVNVFGVDVEGNPIARFLIDNNLGYIVKLILTPILLVIIVWIVHCDRRQRWVVYALLAWYSGVVVHNFIILSRLGLL